MAYFLVRSSKEEALGLADAIRTLKEELLFCEECLNFATEKRCEICRDEERDRGIVVVVEHPRDLSAFEEMGRYRGVYHVLMGRVSPHEGSGPEHLSLKRLEERLDTGDIRELILATNPDAEGDATALAIMARLAGRDLKITRLARGLPTGFTIEYAGAEILNEALEGRRAPGSRGEGGSCASN